jgi:CAAX protease family protein
MWGRVATATLPTGKGIRPNDTPNEGSPMGSITALVRRDPLISFLVLAFALSWGLGAVLNGNGLLAPNASFLLGVPIAALIVIALSDGRAGLKDLGRRIIQVRAAPRWYAVVFALPIVVIVAVLALLPLVGGSPLDWTKQPPLTSIVFMLALFMVFPFATPIAEEIGWRGLALPRLLQGRSALTASLILGVIWALWHLPVVLSAPLVRVPLPFMLAVIPLSVLTTWIFVNTRGSLFVMILLHAWFNAVLPYGFAMVAPTDAALVWWLLAAVQAVAAIVVVAIWGPDLVRRSGKPVDARATVAAAA